MVSIYTYVEGPLALQCIWVAVIFCAKLANNSIKGNGCSSPRIIKLKHTMITWCKGKKRPQQKQSKYLCTLQIYKAQNKYIIKTKVKSCKQEMQRTRYLKSWFLKSVHPFIKKDFEIWILKHCEWNTSVSLLSSRDELSW